MYPGSSGLISRRLRHEEPGYNTHQSTQAADEQMDVRPLINSSPPFLDTTMQGKLGSTFLWPR